MTAPTVVAPSWARASTPSPASTSTLPGSQSTTASGLAATRAGSRSGSRWSGCWWVTSTAARSRTSLRSSAKVPGSMSSRVSAISTRRQACPRWVIRIAPPYAGSADRGLVAVVRDVRTATSRRRTDGVDDRRPRPAGRGAARWCPPGGVGRAEGPLAGQEQRHALREPGAATASATRRPNGAPRRARRRRPRGSARPRRRPTIGVLAPRLTTRHQRACSMAPNSSSGRSCSSRGGQASTTVRTRSPCTGIRSSPSTPRKVLETKCSCSTPRSPRSQPSPTSCSTGMTTSVTVSSTPQVEQRLQQRVAHRRAVEVAHGRHHGAAGGVVVDAGVTGHGVLSGPERPPG